MGYFESKLWVPPLGLFAQGSQDTHKWKRSSIRVIVPQKSHYPCRGVIIPTEESLSLQKSHYPCRGVIIHRGVIIPTEDSLSLQRSHYPRRRVIIPAEESLSPQRSHYPTEESLSLQKSSLHKSHYLCSRVIIPAEELLCPGQCTLHLYLPRKELYFALN